MQLKLLNFHKVLAEFAANLIGAFIPLLVYNSTGVLTYAFLVGVGEYTLRVIFDILFRKLYFKYPQIMLILRVVPMVLCSVSLILIDYSFVAGIIGAVVFNALSFSFRNVPQEIVLNYSTVGKSNGALGLTRLFEKGGLLLGVVLGGLFLDNISKTFVIILASSVYVLSVIPLVIFYIRGKKNSDFNKDISTDIVEYNRTGTSRSENQKLVTRRMLLGYGVLYAAFGVLDYLPVLMSLSIFFNFSGQYFISGLATALYWSLFGIGSTIFGKLDERFDLTNTFIVTCIVLAGMSVGMIFVRNLVVLLVLISIVGFFYSVISIFSLSRMLPRARIMGVGNESLIIRNSFSIAGCALPALAAAIFGLIGGYIMVAVMLVVTAIVGPVNEERTRVMLVDFINDNDYLDDKNPLLKDKLKKRKAERERLAREATQQAEGCDVEQKK